MRYILVLLSIISLTAYAQTGNENYGTNAGNAGNQNSSFGYYAGNIVTGSYNSFFGAWSGQATTSGGYNAMFGAYAGQYNTTGISNVFMGYGAGTTNTTGSDNTYVGRASGFASSTGASNVFVGYYSGRFNTASQNTGIGYMALAYNTSGVSDMAAGFKALYSNTTGYNNTAAGYQALYSNTTGSDNTALGQNALFYNTGTWNTAVGSKALYANTSGGGNTATGESALVANTTGASNTATGQDALGGNTTGSYNTAMGWGALYFNSTGSYNTAIGAMAGPHISNLTNTTALGSSAVPTASNMIKVGDSFVTVIGGSVGWSTISDGRFKKDIKEDITGLAFINELRPVSYDFDRSALDEFIGAPKNPARDRSDGNEIRQTGFIAQEVEEVIKRTGYVFDGVEVPESEHDYYRLRYAQFVVPLVKAVQELSAKIQDQDKKINSNENQIDELVLKLNSLSVNRTMVKGMLLGQNNPNPFHEGTEIRIRVPEKVLEANLVVLDRNGSPVKTYRIYERGETVVKIAGGDFQKGVYFYSLVSDGIVVDTKRMVVDE